MPKIFEIILAHALVNPFTYHYSHIWEFTYTKHVIPRSIYKKSKVSRILTIKKKQFKQKSEQKRMVVRM